MICLIHSEIDEAYKSITKNNYNKRHGFNEEIADIYGRILHLMGELKIPIKIQRIDGIKDMKIEKCLLDMHAHLSLGFEEYRKNNEKVFNKNLNKLVSYCLKLSKIYKFDLFLELDKKIKINYGRDWKNYKRGI